MIEYIIEFHVPIEGASKTHTTKGELYDPDNPKHISEWAYAVAMSKFEVGQVVTEEELNETLQSAKDEQTLLELVDKGWISMTFREDGEVAYFMTDEQKTRYGSAKKD